MCLSIMSASNIVRLCLIIAPLTCGAVTSSHNGDADGSAEPITAHAAVNNEESPLFHARRQASRYVATFAAAYEVEAGNNEVDASRYSLVFCK
jgi:hypothetical protein